MNRFSDRHPPAQLINPMDFGHLWALLPVLVLLLGASLGPAHAATATDFGEEGDLLCEEILAAGGLEEDCDEFLYFPNTGPQPRIDGGCSMSGGAPAAGFLAIFALSIAVPVALRRRRTSPQGRCRVRLERGQSLGIFLAALAVVLFVEAVQAAPLPPTAGTQAEANRQLSFARQELSESRWERALRSARSARTLDPRLAEAMVVTALAYEGTGRPKTARAWVASYLDRTQGSAPSREAVELWERLREGRRRRGKLLRSRVTTPTRPALGGVSRPLGDGWLEVGGTIGRMHIQQLPCSPLSERCEHGSAKAVGPLDRDEVGAAGGLALRFSAYPGSWYFGGSVAASLSPGLPLGGPFAAETSGPHLQFGASLHARVPLRRGTVTAWLRPALGLGLRTGRFLHRIEPQVATSHTLVAGLLTAAVAVALDLPQGCTAEVEIATGILPGYQLPNEISGGMSVRWAPKDGPLFLSARVDARGRWLRVETGPTAHSQAALWSESSVRWTFGGGIRWGESPRG